MVPKTPCESKILTLDFPLGSPEFDAHAKILGSKKAALIVQRLEWLNVKCGFPEDGIEQPIMRGKTNTTGIRTLSEHIGCHNNRRDTYKALDLVRHGTEFGVGGEWVSPWELDAHGKLYLGVQHRSNHTYTFYRNEEAINARVLEIHQMIRAGKDRAKRMAWNIRESKKALEDLLKQPDCTKNEQSEYSGEYSGEYSLEYSVNKIEGLKVLSFSDNRTNSSAGSLDAWKHHESGDPKKVGQDEQATPVIPTPTGEEQYQLQHQLQLFSTDSIEATELEVQGSAGTEETCTTGFGENSPEYDIDNSVVGFLQPYQEKSEDEKTLTVKLKTLYRECVELVTKKPCPDFEVNTKHVEGLRKIRRAFITRFPNHSFKEFMLCLAREWVGVFAILKDTHKKWNFPQEGLEDGVMLFAPSGFTFINNSVGYVLDWYKKHLALTAKQVALKALAEAQKQAKAHAVLVGEGEGVTNLKAAVVGALHGGKKTSMADFEAAMADDDDAPPMEPHSGASLSKNLFSEGVAS